jgi:hypothetical protein
MPAIPELIDAPQYREDVDADPNAARMSLLPSAPVASDHQDIPDDIADKSSEADMIAAKALGSVFSSVAIKNKIKPAELRRLEHESKSASSVELEAPPAYDAVIAVAPRVRASDRITRYCPAKKTGAAPVEVDEVVARAFATKSKLAASAHALHTPAQEAARIKADREAEAIGHGFLAVGVVALGALQVLAALK